MKQYRELPKPTRPANPSPLELAIYQYELKARKFHNDKNKAVPANESKEDRDERVRKRDRDWNHLRSVRRGLTVAARRLVELNDYRESNRQKSVSELQAERHHPTTTLSRNLTAGGEPKPTPVHEAHHIIPGQGKYLKVEMMASRLNLHAYGVGINDPDNGVWLRNFDRNRPDDWATPESPSHRPIHTFNYENWIASRFMNDHLPERVFFNRLKFVKLSLKHGTHPDEILMRKSSDGSPV